MTLERHKSLLIPEVEYSGDGTIIVKNREGTFPRYRAENRERLPAKDYDTTFDYHSFDRRRDEKRRRYKQNRESQWSKEMRDISSLGSFRMSSNSLGRRLRRSKSYRIYNEGPYRTIDTGYSLKRQKSRTPLKDSIFPNGGSIRKPKWGARKKKVTEQEVRQSTNRRKWGQGPKMTPEFSAQLKRDRLSKSLDIAALKKAKEQNGCFIDPMFKDPIKMKKSFLSGSSDRRRRLADERLPAVPFIIGGALLVIIGILRLVLSWWTEYFSALWTGVLLCILGILGVIHRKNYLSMDKNVSYIVFAFLSAMACLSTFALSTFVLIPLLRAANDNVTDAAFSVNIFNLNHSLVGVQLDIATMVWTSIALDITTMILVLVNLYAMTAGLIAIDNYWDAVGRTTGECDHRGRPRYFNPLEQIFLGEATIVVGIVTVALLANDRKHYWSPIWAGIAVILGAFFSTFYGKRTDVKRLAVVGMVMEVAAMAACCTAIVFISFDLEENAKYLILTGRREGNSAFAAVAASACADSLFVLIIIINIIFQAGVLFNICRKMCSKQTPVIECTRF